MTTTNVAKHFWTFSHDLKKKMAVFIVVDPLKNLQVLNMDQQTKYKYGKCI